MSHNRDDTHIPDAIRKRLLNSVVYEPNTGCWIWEKDIDKDGYGVLWVWGKMEKAHRVSYLLFVGLIPLYDKICHKCDTPPCINPLHLFPGTTLANWQDAAKKERHNLNGENSVLAKLTKEEVLFIRVSTESYRTLASRFNVSKSHISRIKNNESWKHI